MGSFLDDKIIEIISNISPGAHRVALGTYMDQALAGILPPGSVSLAEIEKAVTGRVIRSNGLSADNTWCTPGFAGTGATISPTAALDAAPVFTGTPATISPTAALDAAPVFTGSALGTHQHSAEGAGTPAGTNADSDVTPSLQDVDIAGMTWPALALVDNADPVANLDAAFLYAVLDSTRGNIFLESAQDATSNTTFSTGNDGMVYEQDTLRAYGFVRHNATPTGVQIFVDEADNDILKADFTAAGSAGDKYVPLRMGGVTTWLKIIDEDTTAMTELYYDDNGADNAKLVFIDAGTAGGVVHADNKRLNAYVGFAPDDSYVVGEAAGQTFTGSALGTHQHSAESAGTPAGTNDAPAITVTGAAYTPAGTNDAPAITVTGAAYTPAGNVTLT